MAAHLSQRAHGGDGTGQARPGMGPPSAGLASGAAGRPGLARWLVGAVVVLGALATGLAGVLSLVAPAAFLALVGHRGEPLSAGGRIFADYAGARELAIAVALLALLALRSRRALPGLLVVAACANAADAAGALASGRWVQLPGAAIVGLAFLVAAAWLARQP